ncbi:hypothetical protein A11A3_13138 [Alcanivorax hongdengensis A-11-3]|uniref:Glycosyltransferase n=1 Tax=Alcanivorax hongdengensis A-11-3 TaxID=1177179 RepID=L0WCV2_9GAMM|nr:TIGR04282 family arsenosugar biosynthesis glycosyltransferase [Alcanivorax hongdengensis]EKF73575.1 hypothetical protein A11A3_13138 [Alcanivorax hongdengensis A-11-3]
MANTDTALLVFARARRAGQVKTRLIPRYGDDAALAIYQALLQRTLAVAGEHPGPVQLWLDQVDPPLQQQARDAGWQVCLQQGRDLGERMAHALSEGLKVAGKAVLIGSDCPVMDGHYLRLATEALEDHPVVFGASEDGGYVLIGSHCVSLWSEARLKGVRFGGRHALADSQACFAQGDVAVLPALWDVDEPDDVVRAARSGYLLALYAQ